MKTILLAAALLAPIAHADLPDAATHLKLINEARAEAGLGPKPPSLEERLEQLRKAGRGDLAMLLEMTRGPAYRRYVPSLEARVTDLENLHN